MPLPPSRRLGVEPEVEHFMEPSKSVAVLATTLAALIFLAAFMPWGQIQGRPVFQMQGMPPMGGDPFMGMRMSLTVTGWNGNTTLAGISLPNWLVVLAAAGVALLCWLRASSVWRAPPLLPIALAGYGLLHTAFILFVLAIVDEASVGIGSVFSAVTFVSLLGIVIRQAAEGEASTGRYSRYATRRGRPGAGGGAAAPGNLSELGPSLDKPE